MKFNSNIYLFICIIIIIIITIILFVLFYFFVNKNDSIFLKPDLKKELEEKDKILTYKILEYSEFNFLKYNYEEINKNSKFIFTTNNYLDKVDLFLKNYKFVFDEKLKTYISLYIKNNKTNSFQDKNFNFKNFLKNNWKLGLFILNSLDTQPENNLSNYIYFFKTNINNLLEYCKNKKIILKKHDWFLFASYYPTVLLYKLTVDYKLNLPINKSYIEEIFYFIPKINYSYKIRRYGSNRQILSINYLMALFFKLNNNTKDINIFLNKLNNEYDFETFLNNYENSKKGFNVVKDKELKDGLYPNGGFLTHQGFCSYNYLLASLYPNIFYNLFFNTGTESISRILNSFFKICNFKIKKCNPVIISRFGNFNELYNNLFIFNEHVMNLKIFKENKEIQKLHNYIYNLENENNYIHYIENFDIISVFYDNWCIQLKNNNNFSYGEIDKENNNILKQIIMNKIILFKDIKIDKFLNHSKYPGVLFYKKYKDESETLIPEIRNTQTFKYEKTYFSNGLIFENLYFIFNRVTNKELKIEYSEIVFFLPEGIIVCYFDVKTYLNQDLYLCLNNNLIYQNKIFYGVLYDRILNNPIINENNKYHYIKINKDIIYYNFYIDKLFKLNFYNNKNSTNIVFLYKKKNININIKKYNNISIEIF